MSAVVRFGPFALDTGTGELTNANRRVPPWPQPARLLSLLTSRAGELLTREDIRRHLWAGEVFDFDLALNCCLAHLRSILGDRARAPRYVPPSRVQTLGPACKRVTSHTKVVVP